VLWIEGEHLCAAAQSRGIAVQRVLFSQRGWQRPDLGRLRDVRSATGQSSPVAVVDDALFAELSQLESPPDVGYVVAAPVPGAPSPRLSSVVLDRLQDAGNAGSILRSAAALGVSQVLALKGTVALWSPKVLRAGMGAHFALHVVEGLQPEQVTLLGLPLVATSSHEGVELQVAQLPRPCAWVLGHEGQGVDPALTARGALRVRIPQPGGEESLNVAAAAAICFYEAMRQTLGAQ
jgi:TrmH family RNA methyltransferase